MNPENNAVDLIPTPGPRRPRASTDGWSAERKQALADLLKQLESTDDEPSRKRMLVGSKYWAITVSTTIGSKISKGSFNGDPSDAAQHAAVKALESTVAIDLDLVDRLPGTLALRSCSDLTRPDVGRNWRNELAERRRIEADVASPCADIAHLTENERRVVLQDRSTPNVAREVPTDTSTATFRARAQSVDQSEGGVALAALSVAATFSEEALLLCAVHQACKEYAAKNPAVDADAMVLAIERQALLSGGSLVAWLQRSVFPVEFACLVDDAILDAAALRSRGALATEWEARARALLLCAAKWGMTLSPSEVATARTAHNLWFGVLEGDLPAAVRRVLTYPYRRLPSAERTAIFEKLRRMRPQRAWAQWLVAAGIADSAESAGDDGEPGQQNIFAA